MTEARADPNRVATLGDAWMRCRSISCAGWITCQSPTSLRSPPLEIDALGDHLQWLHHNFVNRWCAPARWGSLVDRRRESERYLVKLTELVYYISAVEGNRHLLG